jgi:hypothetical protein
LARAASGFCVEDFLPATKDWREQLKNLEHSEEIRACFEKFDKQIRVMKALAAQNPQKKFNAAELLSCWKFVGGPGTGKVKWFRV